MTRNYTLVIAIAILMLTSISSFSQTCSMSTTNPNPVPGFTTTLAATTANGFSSPDQTTVGTFNKGTTTSLLSPVYSYTTAQTETYFKYHLATSASGSTITGYSITLILQDGTRWTCSGTVSFSVNATGADYYFMFNPADAIPANKYFRIELDLTIAGGGSNKDVIASAFRSNANLAPAGITLPVKFSSFEVKVSSGSNYLTWNVGTEDNLNGYAVERSTDGDKFSQIGFVAASGKSSYSFVDNKASGASYYRVKSVDNDGKYGYSTIVQVKGQQSSVVLKAFPIPVQNQLTIQHGTAGKNNKIELVSADGRLMKSVLVIAGTQQTNVDMSSVRTGVYVVRFIDDANVESLKLVKQ
jgi:hypothetical protein